jgi:hypothetical protein
MLDIAYVALLDFFVRKRRMPGGLPSSFPRDRANAPLATSEGVCTEDEATRRKKPRPEKSTVAGSKT